MLIFYKRNDRVGWLLLPVLVALPAAIASAQKMPSELRPNVRVEGHLQLEYESYALLLHRGQYARISVDAAGPELEGAISEGNKAVVSRFWVAAADTRHIPLVANADVQYLIRISPAVPGDTGSYAIEVEELRDATPRDYAIAEANEYLHKGEELARQQKEESSKQAITSFQKSLEISRNENDQQLQAQALNSLGEVFSSLSDYPAALNNFAEALAAWKQSGDARGQALATDNLGGAYYNLGDRTQAMKYLNDALEMSRSAGFTRGEAAALNDIGVVSQAMGNYKAAIEPLERAVQLYEVLGDQRMEAQSIVSIGVCYQQMGMQDLSIAAFQRALPVIRLNHDKFTEAIALNNLANSYSRIGEKQSALDDYLRALAIEKEEGDRQTEGDTLSNIGSILERAGDLSGAESRYDEALNLAKTTGDRQLEMVTQVRKANTAEKGGEPATALRLLDEALALSKTVKDPRWQATILNNTARIHAREGNLAQALELYSDGLRIEREIGNKPDVAITLSNIADLHLDGGRLIDAENDYKEALEDAQAVGSPEAEEASLYGMARLKYRQNDLAEASEFMRKAARILESLRTKIQGDVPRASYAASTRDQIDFSLELELRLDQQHPGVGHIEQAFELLERSRARGLTDLLRESGVNIREGVNSELLQQERSLNQQIDYDIGRAFKLAINIKHEDELHRVQQHIHDLELELQGVEEEIRRTSPRYAALTQVPSLSVRKFQSEQLGPDTTLLEYSLGKTRSYVFAVSRDSISWREIPNRQTVEELCHRLYDELTAPNQRVAGESPNARARRLANARDQLSHSAYALSEMVLQPVAEQLATKRLLIVSDGALQYIPFNMLPVPGRHAPTKEIAGETPLIAEYEIVNLPSASVLNLLREGMTRSRDPNRKAVAVLADPVFSSDDPRLQRRHDPSRSGGMYTALTAPTAGRMSLEGSMRDAGLNTRTGLTLGRLPFTRMEADAINALAPKGEVWESLDFQASRQTAVSGSLSKYRIVHFATHGLLDSVHPELSGLVFSLVDPESRPVNGFLSLQDIYNLRLPVDLVVLSGCETGLGKEIDGEGLIGLTRGFLYAGAASVVASLWKVEDSATAELMGRFYRRMLQGKEHPASSLRAAQLEMWKDTRWSDPYEWAAFTIQGELR